MNEHEKWDLLLDELIPKGTADPPETVTLSLKELRPFPGHPYKVEDNTGMESLTESVRDQGILTPLLARRTVNGYEVISGHRRLRAAERAGLTEVPVRIVEMDRDAAAVALVDSNLHRDHILPSEKAFAYKLKMEALEHQGKTCGQPGHKSRDNISRTESGRQVQRYLCLTRLIPELLKLVDEGRIALTPAVEISFLPEEEQRLLLAEIERTEATPSLSQAQRLRGMHMTSSLTEEEIAQILEEEKGNQRDFIRIPSDRLLPVLPPNWSAERALDFIIKACEFYRNHLQKQKGGR
ncbi:MAG: ParB/RepB/Spo0J family partition protein [Oscillospiraceae bacterium]|nr:ParB/RepB/Spo0J family partition protein [Oscillospiraceae bacterium]